MTFFSLADSESLSVDFEPDAISLKTVVQLLATIGYEPEINLQSTSKSKQKLRPDGYIYK